MFDYNADDFNLFCLEYPCCMNGKDGTISFSEDGSKFRFDSQETNEQYEAFLRKRSYPETQNIEEAGEDLFKIVCRLDYIRQLLKGCPSAECAEYLHEEKEKLEDQLFNILKEQLK